MGQFKTIVVKCKPGKKVISERTRVLDERVTRSVEEYVDSTTGQTQFRTIEFIEKILEHEVVLIKV